MTTTTYFYQSSTACNTPVDFSDPAHLDLLEALRAGAASRPSKTMNRLMKLAGLQPGLTMSNRPAWSSDIFLVTRDDETGLVVSWTG